MGAAVRASGKWRRQSKAASSQPMATAHPGGAARGGGRSTVNGLRRAKAHHANHS